MAERTTAELREITRDAIGFFMESDPLSSPEDVRDWLTGALMALNERVTRLEDAPRRRAGDGPRTERVALLTYREAKGVLPYDPDRKPEDMLRELRDG